ncbi:MAG TPA: hypothetical protein VGQ10_07320 [Vicinamibacterales bacterium]|jgi:hypothetical protein|nr:hypothetical protein [Vicinamibacterales bacterium]
MHDALMIYFNGEKNAGLFLAGIGLAELAAAALLFRQDLRSLAATIGVLALAEIALGVGLYLRTDPQVGRLVSQLGAEPARFYTDEGARMALVQRNFVIVQYVELAVVIGSAIVAIAQKARPGLTGIALGLVVSAAFLLAFDVVAESRGEAYLAAITGDAERYSASHPG